MTVSPVSGAPREGRTPERGGREAAVRRTQTPHSRVQGPADPPCPPGAALPVGGASSTQTCTAVRAGPGRGGRRPRGALPAASSVPSFVPLQLRNQKEASQSRSQEPQVPSGGKHRR